jgi:carbon monoxide dehydrogenase subunit G
MAEYHFVTTYEIQAPAEMVWKAISDFRQYPAWSKGIFEASQLEPGDGDGVGARVRYKIKGRLPFTLAFHATITRAEAPRVLELQAEGELAGTGRWDLEQDENITTVQYTWDVRTTKRWMNLVAPLARPLFEWNHDGVMREAGQGLARYLDAPLVAIQVMSRPNSGGRPTGPLSTRGVDESP